MSEQDSIPEDTTGIVLQPLHTHLCAHMNIYKHAPECSGGNGVAIFRT